MRRRYNKPPFLQKQITKV